MRALLPDSLPVSRPGVAIGGAGFGVAVVGEAQLGLGVEQVGQGDGAASYLSRLRRRFSVAEATERRARSICK